jgi:hypothetical protein
MPGRAAALLWFIAGTAASAQTGPGVDYDRAALTQAICRQYAAAQRTMPYEMMYAQCMSARGYRVPGFSPVAQFLLAIKASYRALRLLMGVPDSVGSSRRLSNSSEPDRLSQEEVRNGEDNPAGGLPSRRHGQSSGCPSGFRAEFLKLCPHRPKPALEDIDDLVADFGRREADSVYKSTPNVDCIFGPDDHLIGIAIHGDEALGLLDLLHQIIDRHGVVPLAVLRNDRPSRLRKKSVGRSFAANHRLRHVCNPLI